MMNSNNNEQDANLVGKTAEGFVKYYNKNVPATFPHATIKTLNAFRAQYPSLFETDDKWTVNKHRKKFMDWLVSHSEL